MNIQSIKRALALENVLMFLLISVSGNPFFKDTYILLLVFGFSLLIFIKRKKNLSKKYIIFLGLFLIITFSQAYIFSFFSINTVFGVIIRITTAYLIVQILGVKFIDYYIKIMYFISITSLMFYLISNVNTNILLSFSFNTSGVESIYPRYSVMGVFTFIENSVYRNCGPFWEPGAFVGYLVIAFIFSFFKSTKYQKKYLFIFLLSLLTTLSSTGYMALFIFLFFAYYNKIKNIILRYSIVFFLVISAYYAFISLNFLGTKIEKQYKIAKNLNTKEVAGADSQRFINILKDIQDFEGHEFLGRGSNNLTRYSSNSNDQIRTVGLTDLLVKYGIFFFSFIIYLLYQSVRKILLYLNSYNLMNQTGSFFAIIITLISEVYFNYPFYWTLVFLQITYNNTITKGS